MSIHIKSADFQGSCPRNPRLFLYEISSSLLLLSLLIRSN